jgi:hypothetical protein
LRAKIAKLTQESLRHPAVGRMKDIYYIRKEGAGQAVLLGFTNVGKSQMLSSLTNASPEVATYPFTTQGPTPGMMSFENIQIQLVDLPPIVDCSTQSWLPNVVRNADVLLLVVDLSCEAVAQAEALIAELGRLRIKPVGEKCEERQGGMTEKKALILGNKSDLEGSAENYERLNLRYGGEFPIVSISAQNGVGLQELKGEIYRALDIIRVYTKAPGEKPALAAPFILKKGSDVEVLAASIHKDFPAKLKYARVWGSSKFDGQKVRKDYLLNDGDVVEFRI